MGGNAITLANSKIHQFLEGLIVHCGPQMTRPHWLIKSSPHPNLFSGIVIGAMLKKNLNIDFVENA